MSETALDRDVRPTGRPGSRPVVIAHRGASGYRPEHTLASYALAIELGADYVEPDLVSSRDGVLIARHENEISGTTDVAARPEFAARRATRWIDGREVTGWFTDDFTLAELKTLRAVERLPGVRPGNTVYDGRFEVPTFDEILSLVTTESRRRGRRIGVYPETKHPSYFAARGLPLEEPLLAALRRHRMDGPGAKVYIQSFEMTNLRRLAGMCELPLVQLVDRTGAPADLVAAGASIAYADLVTPVGLAVVGQYADAVGVHRDLVLRPSAAGTSLAPTGLVADAHRLGLEVHVWTLRDENTFLPRERQRGADPHARGDGVGQVQAFLAAGVDGVFVDFPDTAVRARQAWSSRPGHSSGTRTQATR